MIRSKPPRRPKTLATKSLAKSWRLEVVEDELKFPDKPTFHYVSVKLPESVIVLARREDGKVPLIRQYRHGARGFFWELPAGYLEEGESPRVAVKREFREEVGHELLVPEEVGAFYLQPSKSNQLIHVFNGKVGKPNPIDPDATESFEIKFFAFSEALKVLLTKPSAMHVLAFLLKQGLSSTRGFPITRDC